MLEEGGKSVCWYCEPKCIIMKNLLFKPFTVFFLLCTLTVLTPDSVTAQPGNEKVLKVSNNSFDLLKHINELSSGKASIYLTITTHQDLAWINSIEKCIIDRDTLWLTPFLRRLRESPAFQMDIEQSSVICEYINRHPEAKDTLIKYMNEGRLLVGAAFTQAYEDMYSGESLARQFYFGKKWLKDNFKGYNTTVYYNSDVPGRSLQMPQLMAKAGVTGMFFSRFERGMYNWYSPDGSFVTAYSPGHYIDFYNILAKDDTAALRSMAEEAIYWLENYNNHPSAKKAIPAVLNYEFGWNQKPVQNLNHFIDFWNNISTIENEKGEKLNIILPQFHFATFDKFINAIKASSAIPKIIGERPNEWVYIHGPSHHWALSASREADMLLPAAEKFWSSIDMINKKASYPEEDFSKAWESKIYPDHGWGGKEGQSTDDIFLAKFAFAKSEGNSLLNGAMKNIASNIVMPHDKGIPVVVFNSLSWKRTGPVTIAIKPDSKYRSLAIYTGDGRQIPSQVSKVIWDKNGYIQNATVTFIATDVPSIGYATYFVKSTEEKDEPKALKFSDTYENQFYQIHFGKGGIDRLIDKSVNKNILSDNGLDAGEIFTLKSEGNGAGEFAAIQQPTMEGFDKVSNYETKWDKVEDGLLYTVFKLRQPVQNAVVEQRIKVYKTIKRIDFNVALKNWDGVLYREYRMALPVGINDAKVSYEVPFGVVEIGKDELEKPAGQIYQTIPKNIHPRSLQNWMNASGKDFGVTLSSSVAAFDFVDITGHFSDATLLQPILLASRRSCHGEGNEYLQTGDHFYNFSLTSGNPGWENGFQFGREANESLQAIVNPVQTAEAKLPEKESFVSVNKKNVIITTMKKAEDDDGIILRFYEIEGKDTNVEFEFNKPVRKVYKTSLTEQTLGEIPSMGNHLVFDIKHNSVETIKIYFK